MKMTETTTATVEKRKQWFWSPVENPPTVSCIEYNRNVYNAYILTSIANRKDEKYKDIVPALFCYALLIMIAQYAAVIILMYLIIKNGNGTPSDGWRFVGINNMPTAWLLFPFFMITGAVFRNINKVAMSDLAGLFATNKVIHGDIGASVIVFKYFGEIVGQYFSAFSFLTVLSLYSSISSWQDLMNLILNLLMYDFIMGLDETALCLIKEFIDIRTGKECNVWKESGEIELHHKIHGSIWNEIGWVVFTAVFFVGIVSRSVLLIAAAVIHYLIVVGYGLVQIGQSGNMERWWIVLLGIN